MIFLKMRWSPYRAILFSLVLVCLNAGVISDSDVIYKLQRDKCKTNPDNYLQNETSRMKCNISFADACWPETLANSTFTQPCPVLFFSPGGFVHCRCNGSGQWEKMNNTQCHKLNKSQALEIRKKLLCELTNKTCPLSKEELELAEELTKVHRNEDTLFTAFSWVSVSIVLPPLIVLVVMKDPNDSDRFSLHTNLLVAFLMKTATYFIEYYVDLTIQDSLQWLCTGVWVLKQYFAVAEVTWMMNEAIFLLCKLVRTFDYNSHFRKYFCLGWGLPALVAFIVYVPANLVEYGTDDTRCWSVHGQEAIMMTLYGPMTFILVINLGIMVYALSTLVIKMKETNTPDCCIARKTITGALILIPQIGIVYLVTFYIPREHVVFKYFVRVIVPLQGALAALVFVPFNSDVREAALLRWYRWQYKNSIKKSNLQRKLGASNAVHRPSRDSSSQPQSRIIEIEEIGNQRENSEGNLQPQPSCSHQTSGLENLSSSVATTKRVITSSSTTQPPIPRDCPCVSTETFRGQHELGLYIRDRTIDAQLQPRMGESIDSRFGEMEAGNRFSFQSDAPFMDEIHPKHWPSARVFPKEKRMVFATQSCPNISGDELSALSGNLPPNICEAFRGYGICDKHKKLKEPTQKRERSSSADCGLMRLKTCKMAWAEDINTGSKKATRALKMSTGSNFKIVVR